MTNQLYTTQARIGGQFTVKILRTLELVGMPEKARVRATNPGWTDFDFFVNLDQLTPTDESPQAIVPTFPICLRKADYIGTVTQWGDSYRLTTWHRNGPGGHHCYKTLPDLEKELRYWTVDPTAGDELDTWTDLPEWTHGLKTLQILACINECSFRGRYELGHKLYAVDVDTALTMIPGILREIKA